MKIKKSELQELIREEAIKFKKALELKKELKEVEKQLSEVYAGDTMSPEKQGGVHAGQKKPVFKKKGDALVEEDEVEEEITMEDFEETKVGGNEEEEALFENLDEPIEGESVAQKTDHPKVDDGMEKCKHVKENKEKEDKPVISEEVNRMKKLAGIK